MREIKTESSMVGLAFFGGLFMWWLSHSNTITYCFVLAVGAVEMLYLELRSINRTLEAIEKKLGRAN